MKKKILKSILGVVLGAALPALAASATVPKQVSSIAGIIVGLGLVHTRAPKDEL